MSDIEVQPCPFCGSDNVVLEAEPEHYWRVECCHCRCHGPVVAYWRATDADNRSGAAAAWNGAARPAAQPHNPMGVPHA